MNIFKNILLRLIDFKISILTKVKNILMSCVFIFGGLSLSGCYTQLAMFYPEPEIEQEEEFQFYETYSRAVPRLSVSAYAQDGAGTSLSLAYLTMYNRFNGFMGFGSQYSNGYYNKYDYYNRYGYGYGQYDSYYIGGYRMYIPTTISQGERKPRTFSTSRDGTSSGTNLNVTRTRSSNTSESSNSGGYSNSSNVSSTRSSSGGSSSSSSSSSSSGRRVTRRN